MPPRLLKHASLTLAVLGAPATAAARGQARDGIPGWSSYSEWRKLRW